MGWIRTNLHWILFALFVVTTLSMVGVGGLAAIAALTAVLALEPALFLDSVAYLFLFVGLGILDVVWIVAAIVVALRRVSLPKSARLAAALGWAEEHSAGLGAVGLSETVAPSFEDRRAALREQYVAGEIGHREFERRLADLLAAEERPLDGRGTVDDPGGPDRSWADDRRGADRSWARSDRLEVESEGRP